ncbi:MAG: transposase, partial [Oscillospiraceae bacterium]|nr:transposase [Oscillospiraceae bacterium]
MKQKISFIVMEDLNICGMMKKKRLAKAIQGQCLYEFIRQIEYSNYFGRIEYMKADRYYPSSKTRSNCGTRKSELVLSDRYISV